MSILSIRAEKVIPEPRYRLVIGKKVIEISREEAKELMRRLRRSLYPDEPSLDVCNSCSGVGGRTFPCPRCGRVGGVSDTVVAAAESR